MKHLCLHCRTRWGIAKPFWHSNEFCSYWCAKEYQKKKQQEQRVKDFHRWLYAAQPP